MKNIYKLFSSIFVLLLIVGCEDDFSDTTDFANVAPPSNISASFEVTQDNTGLVTITPSGEGSISFVIDYGDGSDISSSIKNGGNIQHIYKEGSYTVKVTATGLNGLTAVGEVPLTVSFKAPENLILTIVNDEVKSKQVNVSVTADFATMYEYHPGVAGVDPVTANIGESLSYQYSEAGVYTVRVIAKGAAIETTELTQEFEVTAILAPTVSAPTPPDRPSATVISVYSNKYQDISDVNFYPNWGQTTQFAEYDLNGDKMLQYSNVNYQGIELGGNYDVSSFEYLHVDVWTASPEFENLEISLISSSNGEKPVLGKLNQDQWTSLDIPLTEWTNQGLTIADIFQFKLAINPWNPSGAGIVFLDNMYFWKENLVELPIKFDNEEKFEGKGGFQFALSTDPDDSSNNTGKITTSTEWWDTAEITLDVPIEIVQGSDNNVSVRFYSPNDDKHRLLMKIENVVDPSDNSKNTYLELSKEVSSKGWHDLTYDWSTKTTQNYPNDNQPFDGTGSFERLVFFIDAGSPDWCGDCGTSFGQTLDFYIDDVIKGVPAVAPVAKKAGSVISDFEVDGSLDSFDGGQTEVIDNPDTNGNSSDKVLKLVKNSGQVWAGHKFIVTDKFNFATEQKIKIKMWSPRVGLKLNLKIEDEVPWPGVSATSTITGTSTVANEWEEIEFDFSGDSSLTADDWYNLVFIIDEGTQGDGTSNFTVYIDDITQVSSSTSSVISDFEVDGSLDSFDGGQTEVIDNPDTNGNSSDKVLKLVKNSGQVWAGHKFIVTDKFNFATEQKIKIKMWSPRVGLKLNLKIEDEVPWPGVSATSTITGTSTVANEWEEIEFDFSGDSSLTADDWYNLVFIIDEGTQGDGTSNFTVYIDDITQN
ncbi:MAG: PKD domain-containing protein [Flavobacteriaceae bacterium]